MVRLERFSYAWSGASNWTLRDVSLEIPQGECHWLSGASGSGKTSLALALKELLPPGRQEGSLLLPSVPGTARTAVGLVLQNPETQILTESIGAEVAFGLENLCLPATEMPRRVRAALDAVGLDLPFDHPTVRMSMGQKYRLLLAAQLVMDPALLILDEPAGQLDEEGLQSLAAIIARLKTQGLSVLLCEHRPGPLRTVIDRQWRLEATGRLSDEVFDPPFHPGCLSNPLLTGDGPPVVEARGVTVAAMDASPAWQEVDLLLQGGEQALLCAPNGAGKTTLLRCLAGLIRPCRGSIRICGQPPVVDWPHSRIGYLFQNPRRQLFETSVFDEVAFSLRRRGMRRERVKILVDRVLDGCQLGHLAGRSPHHLSYGQQHLVALASVLAREPELLLLDDPLAGLDPVTAGQVMATLQLCVKERGTTILWTSHHPPQDGEWNHVTLGITGGRLVRH
ncbi:ABC transporter ATP-binding protein [Geopsychrobacter electrodiphilus]|uniref:ABC transporter ATP-binding protein n=1 Tax=Geopsychrobacter electrodiphilus TaxID=225196 RepID=UPI000367FDFE|nr:ABC transporter ATP-binding protein [Geopsychrobacter electrodiphilus]